MTPKSFHALFGRIGVWAKMPFPIHPHMLRHGCGYALANAGHDTRALQAWLGHRIGRLHVRRAKNGTPSVHPLRGEELRALRRLQRECGPSPYVFQSERGGPMTPKSFHALFGRIGVWAKMPFPIHPHMLRHGCGYTLALQARLGHKNIQHTVRYTELAPDRFKNFWRD